MFFEMQNMDNSNRFIVNLTLCPLRGVRVNRSVLAGKKYLPVGMVETTRGCPFSCNFCSVTTFFGRSFRHRPPAGSCS